MRKSVFLTVICFAFVCFQIHAQTPQQQLFDAVEKGDIQQIQTLIDQKVPIEGKHPVTGHTALIAASLNGHTEVVDFLIGKKANVNAADKDGGTALMAAALSGNPEIVDLLIKAKANVNAADKYGDTALIFAAAQGNTEIVSRLIAAKANVNAKDKYVETALNLAADGGYADVVSLLIDAKADVNAANFTGLSPLMRAVAQDNMDLCRLLIEKKASVNAKDSGGNTPLLLATTLNNAEMIQFLITSGANVNQGNNDKTTPVMLAASTGNAEIARILIDAKANVNAVDSENFTALIYAALEDHIDTAKLLLDANAKVDIQTKAERQKGGFANFLNGVTGRGALGGLGSLFSGLAARGAADVGYTALMFAAMNGNDALVDLLLAKNAKINQTANLNTNALYHAANEGHASTVVKLLEAKANINASHKITKNTPLLVAIRSGNIESVNAILAAGGNGKENNRDGITTLMYAAMQDADMLSVILNAGGKEIVNKTSDDKSTALIFAAAKGNTACVKMLVEAGADINVKTKKDITPLHAALAARTYNIRDGLYGKGIYPFSIHSLLTVSKPAGTDMLDLLLKNNVNVNAKDDDGFTPLMLAAATSNTEAVNRLLAAKADIKAATKSGDTAICFAAYRGNAAIVNSLLAAGATPNDKNKDNTTVLMYAAVSGNNDMVNSLLASGADVNAKNKDNATALMAASNGQVTELLLKSGANIGAKNKYNVTSLMFAAQKADSESFDLLITGGANINETDKQDSSVFAYAAIGGNEQLIDVCLDAGLLLNPAKGISPLGASFGYNTLPPVLKPGTVINFVNLIQSVQEDRKEPDMKIIEKLIDAGADVNGGNPTPLFCAVMAAPFEYVEFLIYNGADPSKKSKMFISVTPLKILEMLIKYGTELTEDQMKSYALLTMLEGKLKGKFPHPHIPQRTGLFKTTLENWENTRNVSVELSNGVNTEENKD
jgi:serine/threonine-protein phosphatase 6 regulatory ankyrin repeat subunit B